MGGFDFHNHEGKGSDYFKNSVKHLVCSFYCNKTAVTYNITIEQHKALRGLSRVNHTVLIIKTDNGNGIL